MLNVQMKMLLWRVSITHGRGISLPLSAIIVGLVIPGTQVCEDFDYVIVNNQILQ